MEYIPMGMLEYRFDDKGNATSVVVQLNVYDQSSRDTFNATIELTEKFVKSINPDVDLDKLTKDQADIFARRKINDWVNVKPKMVEDETPAV